MVTDTLEGVRFRYEVRPEELAYRAKQKRQDLISEYEEIAPLKRRLLAFCVISVVSATFVVYLSLVLYFINSFGIALPQLVSFVPTTSASQHQEIPVEAASVVQPERIVASAEPVEVVWHCNGQYTNTPIDKSICTRVVVGEADGGLLGSRFFTPEWN